MADESEPMSEDEFESSLGFSQLNTPMTQNPSKKPMIVSLILCVLLRLNARITVLPTYPNASKEAK